MKKTILASAFSVLALAPGLALGATSAGNGSVGGLAQITSTDAADTYTVVANGSYFITDALETGVGVGWSETDAGDAGDFQFILISPFIQYNFLTDSNVVPFVGAGYDFSGAGDNDDTDFYSVYTGARFFFGENAAVRAELRYRDEVDDEGIGDVTIFQVGIDIFF